MSMHKNCLFPSNDKNIPTEIDGVYVTNKGIFLMEVKSRKSNITGFRALDFNGYTSVSHISGDPKTEINPASICSYSYDEKKLTKMRNPWMQNDRHKRFFLKAVKENKKLNSNIPIFNVICLYGVDYFYAPFDYTKREQFFYATPREEDACGTGLNTLILTEIGKGTMKKYIEGLPVRLTDSEVEAFDRFVKKHEATETQMRKRAKAMENKYFDTLPDPN